MTRRCEVCGEYESENTTMHPSMDICFGCIYDKTDGDDVDDDTVIKIIDNATESKYTGLEYMVIKDQDSPGYRQSMTDAGRGHLLP